VLPQRPTALVAKQAAEVDVLTGGKTRLGVGIGWNAPEYEALGMTFKDRARRIEEQVELEQIDEVGRFKAARDMSKVERRLKQVAEACRNGRNLMPVLIDAVKDYASLGELSDVYRQVFGLYREPIIF